MSTTPTLYEQIEKIIDEPSKWNFNINNDIECSIDKVFLYPHSYNFIFELLWGDGNLRPMVHKMQHFNKTIPEYRYSHTVSLYLLGCYFIEKIGVKKINLPSWDSDSHRNFLHHWAAICLCHDIGYCIENNTMEYPPSKYKNIKNIISKLNCQFDLSDDSGDKLISKYYRYRARKMKKLDHGIISAILLYDSMMRKDKEIENFKTQGAIIISEKPLYGKELENNIMEYSKMIARHNMWFAQKCTDKCTYFNHGLKDLIERRNGSHKISFSTNPMLFLLCLLDTIEIIKRQNEDINIDALKDSYINVIADDAVIKIELQGKIAKYYSNSENWLDVTESIINEDNKIISFNF